MRNARYDEKGANIFKRGLVAVLGLIAAIVFNNPGIGGPLGQMINMLSAEKYEGQDEDLFGQWNEWLLA